MTFEEVDEQLTLPRYNSLCRFWRKCPPTAVLIAKYVGYEAPQDEALAGEQEAELSDEDMQELARVFGLPVRQPKK